MKTPRQNGLYNFVETMRTDPDLAEPTLLKILADPMAEQLLAEMCAEVPEAAEGLAIMGLRSKAVGRAFDRLRKEN
jgi:hypothetical protein